MAEKETVPKEIIEFMNVVEADASLYPETVIFNRVKPWIPFMTTKQVARLTGTVIISTEFRVRIFNQRCLGGDELACEMLDLTVMGDPYSKNPTVQKGLMGLWKQDHDIESGKLLVEIGRLSKEDFDKTIKTGKDKQVVIGGETRERTLCKLAEEARKYSSADDFSMAMIMGKLTSVPQPNTASVYKLIKGRYKGGEAFWHGVMNGELDDLCVTVQAEQVAQEIKKSKPPPKPEVIPVPKPVAPTEPISTEEVAGLEKEVDELKYKQEVTKSKLPPGSPVELDLMQEEAKKRIEAEMEKIKKRKLQSKGQAGEQPAPYGIRTMRKDVGVCRVMHVTEANVERAI